MPRKGGRRKKRRPHASQNEDGASALASNEAAKIPKSVIVRRGRVEPEVRELVADLRQVMRPYTALNFREDASNRKVTMAHYAKELAGPMGVTHIAVLSQQTPKANASSESAPSSSRILMRVARFSAGPTLTFKVNQFSTQRHVRKVQKRPHSSDSVLYANSPIVVTNNFGDKSAAPHVKLMRITFQNMFPAINVAKVKLGDCRRVVLFNYIRREASQLSSSSSSSAQDKNGSAEEPAAASAERSDKGTDATGGMEVEDEEVELRHYAIKATPVGVSRKVRRIVQAKIPNLNRIQDISDYITGQTEAGQPAPAAVPSGAASDSETEDESSHVVLPQKFAGRGNAKSQRSALKLVELGPRLRLKLVKVERGLGEGDVLYHAYIKKTPEEIRKRKAKLEQEAALKKRRREEQEANVERKKKEATAKRDAKRARREERERHRDRELRGDSVLSEDEEQSGDVDASENETGVEA